MSTQPRPRVHHLEYVYVPGNPANTRHIVRIRRENRRRPGVNEMGVRCYFVTPTSARRVMTVLASRLGAS
jgi:hypothetical protein